MIAVIGGSGLSNMSEWILEKSEPVMTPFGKPSHELMFFKTSGVDVIFLPRHGDPHHIPPHQINYRANIWALKSLGVKQIISVATVGSIDSSIEPGALVIPNQIIDYTYGREHTFSDGINNPLNHVDFTYPYDVNLRKSLIGASKKLNLNYVEGGCYAAVNGPRLETAFEINRYEKDGSTIVGMTGMPEASLARELGVAYAAICPVANHAAGRGQSKNGLNPETISKNSTAIMVSVTQLISEVIKSYDH
jgi:5'-methylthioinosine phosphorylase